MKRLLLSCVCALALGASAFAGTVKLGRQDASDIGKMIWKNECGGSVAGLTSWNRGEEFPSLGIGHFIWYPQGVKGPFDESFPKLVSFLKKNDVLLPAWLTPGIPAPWSSREEFLQAQSSERMVELRQMLLETVPLQTEFIMQRLEAAVPKMTAGLPAPAAKRVTLQFKRVLSSGKRGAFALIDYVNFKGEGVLETERYKGQGWGLLQVLEGMSGRGNAVADFSQSAAAVLTRRVKNSPPERHEERWLPGWVKRVTNYR